MADTKLISKIPEGPLAEKWSKRKAEIRIVSPNNKRKLDLLLNTYFNTSFLYLFP